MALLRMSSEATTAFSQLAGAVWLLVHEALALKPLQGTRHRDMADAHDAGKVLHPALGLAGEQVTDGLDVILGRLSGVVGSSLAEGCWDAGVCHGPVFRWIQSSNAAWFFNFNDCYCSVPVKSVAWATNCDWATIAEGLKMRIPRFTIVSASLALAATSRASAALNVVTTTGMIGDVARHVAGDHALVTSLNGRSIYRVSFQDDSYEKILYLEKIYIGERIRDIKYVEKLNVIIIALETTGNIGILKNIY